MISNTFLNIAPEISLLVRLNTSYSMQGYYMFVFTHVTCIQMMFFALHMSSLFSEPAHQGCRRIISQKTTFKTHQLQFFALFSFMHTHFSPFSLRSNRKSSEQKPCFSMFGDKIQQNTGLCWWQFSLPILC